MYPKSRLFLICLFLVVATIVSYWQVQDCAFVDFDDGIYVTENSTVKAGLNLKGIRWAFSFVDYTYWHPLTWLSHMLDCELFGLNPAGHHVTNALFHLANSLLVFLVLRRMTGAVWRSALVGTFFAVHPLQVESVAWITERKNVLSTFFWLLTMWSYVWYGELPGIRRYLLVLFLFVLGLMSKPMLVTLPFVLLLTDYWPLGRIRFEQGRKKTNWPAFKSVIFRLVGEKVPFFACSAASICISQVSLERFGAEVTTEMVPMVLRVENALVSYVRYIGKMVWPENLAAFYPYPETVPAWQSLGALFILAGISFLVVRVLRERPYCAVGWLWYLGTLFPAIGIVQAGLWPAIADRFTYVPSIGLSIVLVWGIADVIGRWRYREVVGIIAATVVLLVFMACTREQIRHWKDTATLFQHALEVTENNHIAHGKIGFNREEQGRTEEAMWHYTEALRINPHYGEVHNNLAHALETQGKIDEAISHYGEALRLKPDAAEVHNNMGLALEKQGKVKEAMGHYSEALRLEPDLAEAHYSLGTFYSRQGNLEAAYAHLFEAVRLKPKYAEAHLNLGVTLGRQGKLKEAAAHLREVVQINPHYAKAHNNLGVVLRLEGKLDEGIHHFEEALRIDPGYADARSNLEACLRLMRGTKEKADPKGK